MESNDSKVKTELRLLTIKEAAKTYNIGEKKIREMCKDDAVPRKFTISNGIKTLINNLKFEDYLNNCTVI